MNTYNLSTATEDLPSHSDVLNILDYQSLIGDQLKEGYHYYSESQYFRILDIRVTAPVELLHARFGNYLRFTTQSRTFPTVTAKGTDEAYLAIAKQVNALFAEGRVEDGGVVVSFLFSDEEWVVPPKDEESPARVVYPMRGMSILTRRFASTEGNLKHSDDVAFQVSKTTSDAHIEQKVSTAAA